ncbi:MAG: asparagine--tRNA ligase [bacterium]
MAIENIDKKLPEKFDWEELYLDQKFSPRITSNTDLEPYQELRNLQNLQDQEVTFSGWVYQKRSSGKIIFLMFRDGSGDIQAIVEKSNVSIETWDLANEITIETSLQLSGKIKADSRSELGFEMSVTKIKIIQIAPEFPINKEDHGPDFLLDHRHLWLRTSKQRAILKIRDEIFYSLTTFLRNDGFVRIDTPIFQPVSCEDTSELFEVNYFGEKTYLTQSGQLYCEAAEFALGKTYDFGPVFRAEKSKTRKHLIEFWMMDAELPFTPLKGLMDFEEKLAKYIIQSVLKNCVFELKILERDTKMLEKYVNESFVRKTHREIIDLLNDKFQLGLGYLDDIGAPEEAKLAELYDLPIFISDWPAEIKAFYMPRYDDGQMMRVKAVDLMAGEGFGEIMGGAEREYDYNKLLDVLKEKKYPYEDYAWYMELRKFGTIPHSGFGIGLERMVRWITGIKHIRETIPFPRMLNRLYP